MPRIEECKIFDGYVLRPCPFCGSPDLYIVRHVGYLDDTVGVFCNTCKQTVTLEDNSEEGQTEESMRRAVDAWNRRADG